MHDAGQGQHDHATRRTRARLGQAIQAQAKEGGFDLELQPTEFAASLTQTDAGKYQMFQIGWSGRVDPDGNIANFVTTHGSQNISGYSNPTVDTLLDQGRAKPRRGRRRDLYGQVITQLHEDAAAHLPLPGEELHRRGPHGRRRAGVRRRAAALRRRPASPPERQAWIGRAAGTGARRRGEERDGRYLLRRLVESAVTFVLVTIVVFIGIRALPGDPARALAGEESDPATLAAIRHSFGLDQPLPVQYLRYVGNALHRRPRPVLAHRAAGGRLDRPRPAGHAAAGRVRDADRGR